MVYYNHSNIIVRDMIETDPQNIYEAELEQGWHPSLEAYQKRYHDRNDDIMVTLVAEYMDKVAGYINLIWNPTDGAFAGMGIPEVYDFGVFEKYRRHGIGTILMDVVEGLAGKKSDKICLGVGAANAYGSAQRMYVKRGYLPDGTGVWYQNKICPQYTPCNNDDDLLLFLVKSLKIELK